MHLPLFRPTVSSSAWSRYLTSSSLRISVGTNRQFTTQLSRITSRHCLTPYHANPNPIHQKKQLGSGRAWPAIFSAQLLRNCSHQARLSRGSTSKTAMADRDILPDDFKPSHYDLVIRDLDFKTWTYKGTVRLVVPPNTPKEHNCFLLLTPYQN